MALRWTFTSRETRQNNHDTPKLRVMGHACNSNTLKVEAGGFGAHSPLLNSSLRKV